jgi:hypothetical protein
VKSRTPALVLTSYVSAQTTALGINFSTRPPSISTSSSASILPPLTYLSTSNYTEKITFHLVPSIEVLQPTTMGDDIYFEPSPNSSTRPSSYSILDPSSSKPADEFSTPALRPNTIFYLATIAPHTDTYSIYGPTTSFQHLFPKVNDVVSNSPKAIDKLEALSTIEDMWGGTEPNHDFNERGFGTFVVEGQRGVYTVLKILREVNRAVFEELPSPVYTVTVHGPLTHDNQGYVKTTRLVGSFTDRKEAKAVAEKEMRELVKGEKGVKKSEDWGRDGKGGGILMAMSPEARWEVKIAYEDQVHKRAKEELERGGGHIGWRF